MVALRPATTVTAAERERRIGAPFVLAGDRFTDQTARDDALRWSLADASDG